MHAEDFPMKISLKWVYNNFSALNICCFVLFLQHLRSLLSTHSNTIHTTDVTDCSHLIGLFCFFDLRRSPYSAKTHRKSWKSRLDVVSIRGNCLSQHTVKCVFSAVRGLSIRTKQKTEWARADGSCCLHCYTTASADESLRDSSEKGI